MFATYVRIIATHTQRPQRYITIIPPRLIMRHGIEIATTKTTPTKISTALAICNSYTIPQPAHQLQSYILQAVPVPSQFQGATIRLNLIRKYL